MADLATFSRQMGQLSRNITKNTGVLKGRIALEIQNAAILIAAVDTGRFRSSIKISIGSPVSSENLPSLPLAALQAVPINTDLFIGSAVPYAQRLEMGSSRQSPTGTFNPAIIQGINSVRRVRFLD